ncbi:MAG: response regulator [Actinobacteria bacterium]|nr:response regulator [Actinomycetota bacterium]MSZ32276.1 response regulator [Actinomycetota bacterium]MSZ42474.1 response regulator [Actinomycetota bacterium]MSZ91592.1 response regulator [Actinomycetota bacterium]MTA99031.1 response regulator [Actinomycetota bacterium]
MKVVLVDDHPLIRKGLSQALNKDEISVVGEASSLSEGVALLNSTTPDICIVDLNLGSASGIELIKVGMVQNPNCAFVVLTMEDDLDTLITAKAAGARAYITKGSPVENLIEVVKTVLTDRKDFIKLGSFKDGAKRKDFGLTERELEVLQLLSSGATASAMGSILFLSEATIKSHLAAIYRKLEAANRAQAVSIAISEKLILK